MLFVGQGIAALRPALIFADTETIPGWESFSRKTAAGRWLEWQRGFPRSTRSLPPLAMAPGDVIKGELNGSPFCRLLPFNSALRAAWMLYKKILRAIAVVVAGYR